MKNRVAPINKIPSEILTLVPDFLHSEDGIVTLTHVCQAWREAFISRSSLWTRFNCEDSEKTRIYLERSKSSPIHLSCDKYKAISPHDPFFQIIPHATGRLKSLFIKGTTENVQVITSHLSHPAPLLEFLSIANYGANRPVVITSAHFGGDLSSLRTLHLDFVRTELPWRNMANLTSFKLSRTPPGAVSVEGLLDFFESAPCLHEVELCDVTPTTGVQQGRLVSLACLKGMSIDDCGLPSALLEHLLIPVGVELETMGDLVNSLVGEALPRSLDNLKNLSNFTTVKLYLRRSLSMEFSGPNGRVSTTLGTSQPDPTDAFEALAQLDTSKTEWLEIHYGCPPSWDLLNQTLLSMVELRTLQLGGCGDLYIFTDASQPGASSSEVVSCPNLEKLILYLRSDEEFDIVGLVEMAAARASRGKKLRTIKIIDNWGADYDVSELKKYVWKVEREVS